MKKAIIIGAGPAGLTAAYELLKNTNIKPVIYEATGEIGGIARTYNYKGNRMDMGGHRFFSKSDRVMQWWLNIMPLQGYAARDDLILGNEKPLSRKKNAPDPEKEDRVMLFRKRLSRIYYLRRFFDYPVTFNMTTVSNLGFVRIVKIGFSYFRARIFPIKQEKTLEDFLINRFGKELYMIFFKDYTEKVWGIPPSQIKADWGAQRIKGISIGKVLSNALSRMMKLGKGTGSLSQKDIETSLIEQFLYPKYGPGHLWEEVAHSVKGSGGEVHLHIEAVGLKTNGSEVTAVILRDKKTQEITRVEGDYFFSTMPVRNLISGMENVPSEVRDIAAGLVYRDFITMGLLVNKLKIKNSTKIKTINNIIPDLWIYIQERDVKIGRLQVFNNWSPYMVEDDSKVWIGLEYFCNEGDSLWIMPEEEFKKLVISELVKIGFIDKDDVLDYKVIKVPKAYPAYFGTYDNFHIIKNFVDTFDNLFLIGRNGMHRYNNMDHSMLSAMRAVENIKAGILSKENIWSINIEEEYHEEASDTQKKLNN